ncbi:MAG: cob(I)yrinic acid a,c-diamide adenosyltransferase [bacterium]|nr:cob(I)yrinic acid a,c-diamide adenosyltransferase [bacterium]
MKTRFFTGKGDKGKSFVGGKNFSKGEVFFELIGVLDELNSWLGVCRASAQGFDKKIGKRKFNLTADIGLLQNFVFIVQAEFAALRFGYPKSPKISKIHTDFLEKFIEKVDSEFPPLTKFVISGGSELSAQLDFARTLARRAEREAVKFSAKQKNNLRQPADEALRFLNRLSSVLFALARYVNFKLKIKELNPSYK